MNIQNLIDLSIFSGMLIGGLGLLGTIVISDSKETKNWHFAVTISMIVIGLIMVFGVSGVFIGMQNDLPVQTETKTMFQDIYSATVPYGIISVHGSGWSYYYSLNYAEVYSVKVMNGNEVLTYSYRTDQCRVIVDGTFKLETTDARYYKIDPYDGSRIYCFSDGWRMSGMGDGWDSVKPTIHIPAMPIPQNTTTNWYVGG